MKMIQNIKDLTFSEIQQWCTDHDLKPFRATQIFHWLYQQRVSDFSQMKNLAKTVVTTLEEHFYFSKIERSQALTSSDGSIKYSFQLGDGLQIESVLMPHLSHYTLCVSSQVGCAMGCDFCMTAKMGWIRHLSPGEIIDQVLEAWKDLPEGERIRNIVFMGMGEPFHNYDNVIKTLSILMQSEGFDFSSRRITVSTSGLVPQIIRFGKESIKANLAISLNGVTDEVRSQLMPINKAYNLERLLNACKTYPLESRKRITFEYILMDGVTDSLEDANRLVRLLHGLRYKINLIPYNESPESRYRTPSWDKVTSFQKYLLDRGITATLRISKGQDIQGACGQLIRKSAPTQSAIALMAG